MASFTCGSDATLPHVKDAILILMFCTPISFSKVGTSQAKLCDQCE